MYCSDQPAKWVGLRVGHLAFTLWASVLLAALVVPLIIRYHHAMEQKIFGLKFRQFWTRLHYVFIYVGQGRSPSRYGTNNICNHTTQ